MADPTAAPDVISVALYYLNQGGPALQGAIIAGLYKGYKMVADMLSEVRRLNLLIAQQNGLMEKLIEQEKK